MASEIKLQCSSKTAQKSGSASGPKSDTNVFASHSQDIIGKAVEEPGAIDILVNNAAHQAFFKNIEDITDEEWELTFKVNIHAMFYLTKAAVPFMKPGSSIINTTSI